MIKNEYIFKEHLELIVYGHRDEVITVLLDLSDYEKVSETQWQATRLQHKHVFYIKNKKNGYLHRFLLNAPKGLVVDHINGNSLDNRKENLRICTQKQNIENRKISKNNTSGVKGVSFCNNKYVAMIMNNYKQIYLGSFDLIEHAIIARKNAEKKYFTEPLGNCKA